MLVQVSVAPLAASAVLVAREEEGKRTPVIWFPLPTWQAGMKFLGLGVTRLNPPLPPLG